MKTLMQLPPELGERASRSSTSGSAASLADPDPATIGARAEAAFARSRAGLAAAPFQSVDMQLAARDEAALAAGDYLAVVGDVHAATTR